MVLLKAKKDIHICLRLSLCIEATVLHDEPASDSLSTQCGTRLPRRPVEDIGDDPIDHTSSCSTDPRVESRSRHSSHRLKRLLPLPQARGQRARGSQQLESIKQTWCGEAATVTCQMQTIATLPVFKHTCSQPVSNEDMCKLVVNLVLDKVWPSHNTPNRTPPQLLHK